MRFRDFEAQGKDLPIFNLNDVRKIAPGFHRQQLSTWHKLGMIKHFAGGYYLLPDTPVDETLLFMAANKLYEPSYVSLESALAYYQVIPETVLGMTSITSRKTKTYESTWGLFSYRSVKPLYMFGYRVVEFNRTRKFKMAVLEKAVLDYLYLNSNIHSSLDFEALRWNQSQLQQLKESEVLLKYLKLFNKKVLQNRVRLLMEYLNA